MTRSLHSHRPLPPKRDEASGAVPPRIIRRSAGTHSLATKPREQTGTGGTPPPPAGSLTPRERAQLRRIYGGPTLETQIEDANYAVMLSSGVLFLLTLFAMLFAGWGYLDAARFCAWATLPTVIVFFEAVTRRNRRQDEEREVQSAADRAVDEMRAIFGLVDVPVAEAA